MIIALCAILGGILGAFIYNQDHYWFTLLDNPNFYPGSGEPSSLRGPIKTEGLMYIAIGIACGAMIGFLVYSIVKAIKKSSPNSPEHLKENDIHSNIEELKNYKELLDSGIITQEEFDQKKKEILGD